MCIAMVFGLSIEELIILVGVFTVIAVPCFDFLTWIFISIWFYKINPFAKESGKKGDYIGFKRYTTSGKIIADFQLSFEELFGLTTNTAIKLERDNLEHKVREQQKQIEELKQKNQEKYSKEMADAVKNALGKKKK
jgi:hypothetical protein